MTDDLRVTFLGTGTSQGIPVIGSTHPVCLSDNPKDKRLRVSVLLSWKDYNYVIDCGPDFRQQMLRQKMSHLNGILYTHEHSDHTAGLDDIRPFFFKQGDIPIYAHKRVVKSLKKRFGYILNEKDKYPGAPSVHINKVKNNLPFLIGDKVVVVNALRLDPHISHFNLKEALAFIEIVKPEKAYFTHISHLLGFHDEVEKSLPKNVHLAYDNLTITL